MNALPKKTDVGGYASDRVFNGKRQVTDTAKADRMRTRVEKDLAAAGIVTPKDMAQK